MTCSYTPCCCHRASAMPTPLCVVLHHCQFDTSDDPKPHQGPPGTGLFQGTRPHPSARDTDLDKPKEAWLANPRSASGRETNQAAPQRAHGGSTMAWSAFPAEMPLSPNIAPWFSGGGSQTKSTVKFVTAKGLGAFLSFVRAARQRPSGFGRQLSRSPLSLRVTV